MDYETANQTWNAAEEANPGVYERLTPAPGGLLKKVGHVDLLAMQRELTLGTQGTGKRRDGC